jgi:hypothetical protein
MQVVVLKEQRHGEVIGAVGTRAADMIVDLNFAAGKGRIRLVADGGLHGGRQKNLGWIDLGQQSETNKTNKMN